MAQKRLYTLADVQRMQHGDELALGPDAIATPSALDLAFERGIRVRRSEKRESPEGGEERNCLWNRMLESDGSYVVEAKGGHASVFRLTETGPVAFGTDNLEAHPK
jgi:hypothetical protein